MKVTGHGKEQRDSVPREAAKARREERNSEMRGVEVGRRAGV